MERLIALGIILLFAAIFIFLIRMERRGRAARRQMIQALGFTPIEPPPELSQKIFQLYDNIRGQRNRSAREKYRLRNVASKTLPDAEMYIFDLIDTSGSDSDTVEQQAVAILSPHLSLPAFILYPKADTEGPLTNLSNRVLNWVVSKFGDPVAFPEHPEFERKYLVSSPDPASTRQFLDDTRIHRLEHTRLLTIQAGDDLFTLTHMEIPQKPISQESLGERVNLARDVFSIFA